MFSHFLGRLACFLIIIPGSAHSATFFTAKTGNDDNSCAQAQNDTTPKLTVAAGISCLSSGDTLVVKAGTYAEQNLGNSIPSGTSWDSVTTVMANPGDSVIIRPANNGTIYCFFFGGSQTTNIKSYIELAGFECDGKWGPGSGVGNGIQNGLKVEGPSHHIRLRNMEFHSAGGSGVGFIDPTGWTEGPGGHELLNVSIHNNGLNPDSGTQPYGHGLYFNSDNSKIWNCDFYDNTGTGAHIFSNSGDTDNNDIQFNRAWGNGWLLPHWNGGLLIDGSNNLVANNIIWGNTGKGLTVWNGDNNKIYNNTITEQSSIGPGIYLNNGTSNTQIINNIIYEPSLTDIITNGTTNTQISNYFSNPLFLDPVNKKFELQTNSGARNAGTTLPEVPVDFVRTPRPQSSAFDIGAYEYNETQSAQAAPMPPTLVGGGN